MSDLFGGSAVSWPLVKLGDLSEVIMGQAPPSSDCNKNAVGIPFVKAGEFGIEKPIIREWTTNPLKFAKVNDVLLCVVGATCGKINKGVNCAIGRSVAAIRADERKLDKDYMYYFLSSWTMRLRAMSQGAAQTVISKEMVECLEIPLPPLAEQKRIAAILDKADAIRRKRQQAIKLADEFLRSVFLDMFGDPVSNPKGIRLLPMTECFDITTGKLNSNAAEEHGEYPFFTCAKEVFAINDFAFDQEALLLAGNNAQADYDVKYYKGKFNAYQRTYVLTLKNINWSYEFYKFALEYQLQNLKRSSKGSNTKYITMEIMSRTMLPAASETSQKKFVVIYNKQLLLKTKQQRALLLAEANFNSLSQKAFSGQL